MPCLTGLERGSKLLTILVQSGTCAFTASNCGFDMIGVQPAVCMGTNQ